LLNNAKVVHVLKRLSDTYLTGKNEGVSFDGPLTVEHILPQQWPDKWLLPDGSKGMTTAELWTAAKDDPRAEASRNRNKLLQTFGNLTILTQALNSSVSNSKWAVKRPELLKYSLLPITNFLESIVCSMRQYAHEMQTLLGRSCNRPPFVAGHAPAGDQGHA
jgi:hypothetical protein